MSSTLAGARPVIKAGTFEVQKDKTVTRRAARATILRSWRGRSRSTNRARDAPHLGHHGDAHVCVVVKVPCKVRQKDYRGGKVVRPCSSQTNGGIDETSGHRDGQTDELAKGNVQSLRKGGHQRCHDDKSALLFSRGRGGGQTCPGGDQKATY